MPSSTMQLSIDILAVDAASSVFKSISGAIGGINGPAGAAAAAITAIGGAAVGMAVSSVQAASQFQAGMTSLVTGAGEAQSNIKLVSDGILKMATDTGTSTDQLTAGMYQIESSGQHGASGLQVLTAAAQGAKVGNADLGVTANALTTILTDYHLSGTQAASAMNGLTATVASGKTHLQDLASSMAAVLPLSSSLGISFPQVAGGLATMTNAGMSAEHASQNLANAIRSLAAPGNSAVGAMQNVGLSAQQLKNALTTQGLTGAIQLVEDHVGKKFPAGSVQAVEAFKSIMGGATGYNVALQLGGQNMAAYEANVKSITAAMAGGNGTVTGFADVQNTMAFQVSRAQAAFQALQIQLGTVFLPVLTQLVGFVANAISGFTAWEQSTGALQNAMSGIGTVIQGVLSLISGGFSGLPDLATGWGQNMVTGFANGVISALNSVVTAVATIVNEIDAYIGFASPSKKGPGRNLTQWGQNLAAGFAVGMVTGASQIDAASAALADHIKLPGQDGADDKAKSAGLATVAGNMPSISQSAALSVVAGNMPLTAATSKTNTALKSVCQTASGVSSCVSSNTAAMASATSTNGAKAAAAAQKHAASQAATAAKHAASVAKHNATVQASAQKHAASVAKHNATVEAAAQKHQQVLAREAANAAKRLEAQHAAAAKKAAKVAAKSGGGAGGDGAIAPALANAANVSAMFAKSSPIAQAQQAGANVASAYAKGLSTIKSAVGPEMAGISSFITSTISAIAPMIKPTLQILMQIFTGLWNTIKALGSAVASTLLPAFGNLVAAIAPIISGLLSWLASSGLIKVAFAILAATIQVVVATIAGLISAVAAIITFFSQTQLGIAIFQALLIVLGLVGVAIAVIAGIILSTMIPAFVAWVAGAVAVGIANVIAFGPIVLIVLAVIAVIAAVILIVKNWGAIAGWLQGVWSAFLSWFSGAMKAMGTWWAGVWQGMQALAAAIWQGIVNAVKIGVSIMLTIVFGPILAIVALFAWLYNHNYYFKDLVDAIVKFFTGCFTWLTQQWTRFTSWLSGIWKGIQSNASSAWQNISDTVQQKSQQAGNWLQSAWNTASTNTQSFMSSAWKTIQAGWKLISDLFALAWTKYIGPPLISGLNTAIAMLTSFGTQAYRSGSNFVAMLANGITSGAGWIWNAVKGIANTIWTALGFHSPPKGGPLRDSDKYMPRMIKMMADGLNKGVPTMAAAAKNVAGAIAPAVNPSAIFSMAGGVALPNYAAGTATTINTPQPASGAIAHEMHIHVHLGDSGGDANQHGRKVADAVKKELAKQLRGQGNAPRLIAGGH